MIGSLGIISEQLGVLHDVHVRLFRIREHAGFFGARHLHDLLIRAPGELIVNIRNSRRDQAEKPNGEVVL